MAAQVVQSKVIYLINYRFRGRRGNVESRQKQAWFRPVAQQDVWLELIGRVPPKPQEPPKSPSTSHEKSHRHRPALLSLSLSARSNTIQTYTPTGRSCPTPSFRVHHLLHSLLFLFLDLSHSSLPSLQAQSILIPPSLIQTLCSFTIGSICDKPTHTLPLRRLTQATCLSFGPAQHISSEQP